MRRTKTSGSLRAQAIAGTHTVLLGWSLSHRKRCLGVGIHRTDHTEGDAYWLRGMKTFTSVVPDPEPGQSFPLDRHPIQGFQWGDYTAKPGHDYTYRIVAFKGTPAELEEKASVSIRVQTEDPDDGTHGIWFNRGVAGSQAYRRRFGDTPAGVLPDDDPRMVWLSRGLAESFKDFVATATGPEWAIRGAFYEFSWPGGLAQFHTARARGVDVRLVVHGRGPDETATSNREAADDADILNTIVWRQALNKSSLQHNKFIVLVHHGTPVALWTGSTNLTRGGIFGQSNVGHVIRDQPVAQAFSDYWDQLADPDVNTKALRIWCEQHNAVSVTDGIADGMTPIFSPRNTKSTLLGDYAEVFDDATSSAHITGAFGINPVFITKLARERAIPRTVLLDKQQGTPVPKNDRDVRISTGAHLWLDGLGSWAKERLTGYNGHVRYVHTKIIMMDPLTATPTVVTGSANYSKNSTVSNEENTVIIKGNTRVADIYLTEYHRLFMHFPFRRWANSSGQGPRPLAEDDSWTNDYYDQGHWRQRQRILFSGG